MEAIVRQYETLAASSEVKAALAAINAVSGSKVTLGPALAFMQTFRRKFGRPASKVDGAVINAKRTGRRA